MFWFDIDHKTKLYFRDSGSDLAEVQSQGTHNPLIWARCGKMAPGGAHSYEGSGVWSAACICKPARCFPIMRAAYSQPSCTGWLLLQPAAQPSWLQDSSSELPCVIMPQERGREEVQSVICTQPGWVFAYTVICPGWGRKKRWTRFSWYPHMLYFKSFTLCCPIPVLPCSPASSRDARRGTQPHPSSWPRHRCSCTAGTSGGAWSLSAAGSPPCQTGFKRAVLTEFEGFNGYQRADSTAPACNVNGLFQCSPLISVKAKALGCCSKRKQTSFFFLCSSEIAVQVLQYLFSPFLLFYFLVVFPPSFIFWALAYHKVPRQLLWLWLPQALLFLFIAEVHSNPGRDSDLMVQSIYGAYTTSSIT